MDWRKDIHIEEIKSAEVEKTFQKNIRVNKNPQTAHVQELEILGLSLLATMGALLWSIPGLWPAVGLHYFLGIDFALWYDAFAFLSLSSALGVVSSIVSRYQHKSSILSKLFAFFPMKGKIPVKYPVTLFIISQVFFMMVNIGVPGTVRSMEAWRSLEAQHLDSRDPVKREFYAQQKAEKDRMADIQAINTLSMQKNDGVFYSSENLPILPATNYSNNYSMNGEINPLSSVPNNLTAKQFQRKDLGIALPTLPETKIDTSHLTQEQVQQVQSLIEQGNMITQAIQHK